jgi:ubiquinone/menaquinone biosynthesis C-methylase UbiE
MNGPTWESIADWYADKLAAGSPIHQWTVATLLAELPDLPGQPVLDLGCGEGLVTRALAERGAHVTGVDLSERLLAHARRQEAARPLGINYQHGDARTLHQFPDVCVAGVVANLSLNDMPDLDHVVTAVRRVLRPGGWFVFTVPHPCFETPHASWGATPTGQPARLVNRYFDETFWRSTNPQGCAACRHLASPARHLPQHPDRARRHDRSAGRAAARCRGCRAACRTRRGAPAADGPRHPNALTPVATKCTTPVGHKQRRSHLA